jgi:hypothetical protein
MIKKIWAASGLGLGDCWASVNYILRQSVKNNKTEYMSHYYKKGDKKRVYYNKANEILPLIDSMGKIELINEDPTEKLTWKNAYKVDYFPSIKRWMSNKSKDVCYQFDGKSHNCKNMRSKDEEEKIIVSLKKNGFNPIRLGGHLSLEESVSKLSECEFFVGVESGFAHIACSVGTPLVMIINGRTYRGIKDSHENREMILCEDYISTILAVNELSKGINYYNEKKVLIK